MYERSYKSLSQHPLPKWYDDAKLGIFIHWGLYSVPAWAEPGHINDLIKEYGHGPHFYHNSYAEWYQNTYALEGSPAHQYHQKKYGNQMVYKDFQQDFEKEAENFKATSWAKDFKEFGAKYVVMVTKHHDGYCMWPSQVAHPLCDHYKASRDYVGELTKAVRDQGMEMGMYYSGVIDWSVRFTPSVDTYTLSKNFQHDKNYIQYATDQYKELIDRYQPAVLWNDIGYPWGYDLKDLMSYYYNKVPGGVINDRWEQELIPKAKLLQPIVKWVCEKIDKKTKQIEFNTKDHKKFWFDYKTQEYSSYEEKQNFKWEIIRGVGHSFAYNQLEGPEHMLTGKDLIYLLVDTVSKNGNLLINVGPKPDGTLPEMQEKPLRELGAWLKVHGQSIYGTRPHRIATQQSKEGYTIRYTRNGKIIYMFAFGVEGSIITVSDEVIEGETVKEIRRTENDKQLAWDLENYKLNVELREFKINLSEDTGVSTGRQDIPHVIQIELE